MTTPGVNVLLDRPVSSDYGTFEIFWEDGGWTGHESVDSGAPDSRIAFAGQSNGIVGAAAGRGVLVIVGQPFGYFHVKILLHDGPPGASGLEPEWEDVVEVSVRTTDGLGPGWFTWFDSGDLPGLIPGSYRLRLSERGRDQAAATNQEFTQPEDVVDFVLIQFWPAPAEPDAILRVGTESARIQHSAWGGKGLP